MSFQPSLTGPTENEPPRRPQLPPAPRPTRGLGITLLIVVLGVGAFFTITSAWRSVNPGYVGVIFDKVTHSVTAEVLEPGWAFINPVTQSIQEYPITIQTYAMVQRAGEGSAEGDDSIKIQSSEGQELQLDVVIQYQVIKEQAGQVYQDWGGAEIGVVEDRVVRQYTRSQVPVIVAQYGWEAIAASKRGEIATQIGDVLTEEFDRRHLRLISFGIREVHLPATLQEALNQKITAQQQAEQQKYQLEQAKVRAEQDRVVAEGQANALMEQAKGEAEATRIRAEAQAVANQLLAESLTAELISYQQVQRWDGKLPIFSGNGMLPLLDSSNLLSPAAEPAAAAVPTEAPAP